MAISLYDVSSGEQVASLVGHNSWVMSLDFSFTGEWLLSGYVKSACALESTYESSKLILAVLAHSMAKSKSGAWKLEAA